MKLSPSVVQAVWEKLLSKEAFDGTTASRSNLAQAMGTFEVDRHVQTISLPPEFDNGIQRDGLIDLVPEGEPLPSSWFDALLSQLGMPLHTLHVDVGAAILMHSALDLHRDGDIFAQYGRTVQRTTTSAAARLARKRGNPWKVQCSLLFPIRNGITFTEYKLTKAAYQEGDASLLSEYYTNAIPFLKKRSGEQKYLRQGLIQYPSELAFDRRFKKPLRFFDLEIGQDFLLVQDLPHGAWYVPDTKDGTLTAMARGKLALDQFVEKEYRRPVLTADNLYFGNIHAQAISHNTPSTRYPSTLHLEISIAAENLDKALLFLNDWYTQQGHTPSPQVQYMMEAIPAKTRRA